MMALSRAMTTCSPLREAAPQPRAVSGTDSSPASSAATGIPTRLRRARDATALMGELPGRKQGSVSQRQPAWLSYMEPVAGSLFRNSRDVNRITPSEVAAGALMNTQRVPGDALAQALALANEAAVSHSIDPNKALISICEEHAPRAAVTNR